MLNWKQISKVLIPLSFLSLNCVFAEGELSNASIAVSNNGLLSDCNLECPKPKQIPCEQPKKIECAPCVPCVREGITPFVLTTSRPCYDVGVYFFVDALYWHADIGNSDYAYVQTSELTPTSSVFIGKNEQLNFKWNWGFKVGLGFDLNHDEWDTDFYYTWFVNKTQPNSFTTRIPPTDPTEVLVRSLVTNYPFGGVIRSGSASARLNFNVLDWEIGRWFYISDSISIRPHAGLRGSWIRLKQKVDYVNSPIPNFLTFTSYHGKNNSKSWAAGPSIGVKSNWYFGSGNTIDPCDGHVRSRPHFSIFGDFTGALMYSHFKNSHSESSEGPANATIVGFNSSHLNRNLMVPVLTGFMGLAYDTCFNCDKYHFGIRLGYELQYWFRQNQRFAFDDVATVPRYTRSTGEDLALQGMTLDIRFDF